MSFRKLLPVISNSVRAYSSDITDLKGIVAQKIVEEQKKVKTFRQTHGLEKVGDVNVNMLYGGMRGLLALVTETSILDPELGIRFRGLTIPDIQKKLPKAPEGESPLPEGLFWLLLTSDIPNDAQADWVSKQWAERATIPDHALTMLNNFPTTMHPMSQLSATVIALNQDSKFVKAYKKGINKATYWEYFYEDSMDLLARLPTVAATIYRNNYKGRTPVSPLDQTKDWSYNMATMMGYDDPKFIELIRLYLTIHCDHEGGNVSAHAAHLVGSSLSDPYLSYAAGLNGLAGPLHGLANQEVLEWLKRVQQKIGDNVTDHQLKEFIQDTLKEGKVIPGFGHSVLRKTDPRYICQREFALKYMPNDPLFKLVSQVYKIVPQILKDTGKVQNPWPNVDAHSGCLLYHYNLKETQFYTVMFGVSRAIGVLSSLIWDRALGLPIERPKSITTNRLIELVQRKVKETPKPLAEAVVTK